MNQFEKHWIKKIKEAKTEHELINIINSIYQTGVDDTVEDSDVNEQSERIPWEDMD